MNRLAQIERLTKKGEPRLRVCEKNLDWKPKELKEKWSIFTSIETSNRNPNNMLGFWNMTKLLIQWWYLGSTRKTDISFTMQLNGGKRTHCFGCFFPFVYKNSINFFAFLKKSFQDSLLSNFFFAIRESPITCSEMDGKRSLDTDTKKMMKKILWWLLWACGTVKVQLFTYGKKILCETKQ